MKSITLILAIILCSTLARAQEMYLKKTIQDYISSNNFDYQEDYYYLDNWNLDSIVRTKNDGSVNLIYRYENDILKELDQITHSAEYIYYYDHIDKYYHSNSINFLSAVYNLNYDEEVIQGDIYNPDGSLSYTEEYIWTAGNCETYIRDETIVQDFTYYQSVKNPFYNNYKYFKIYLQGSVNYPDSLIINGSIHEHIVENTLNDYPVEVKIYINGVHTLNLTFEYYIIDDIDENINQGDPNILSVKYYNLLGQEIGKPIKGFYIERLLTEKGIISKKFYIP